MTQFATEQWFKKHQLAFNLMLNNPIPSIREYFRDKLDITYIDPKTKITKITPNAVHYRLDKKYQEAEIYSGNKYEWNLKKQFDGLFKWPHLFDQRIANPFIPVLNLGYDTLTSYSRTADALNEGSANAWSTCRDTQVGFAYGATSINTSYAATAWKTGATFVIDRSFFYFDTSSITSGKTVSNAVFSLYGYSSVSPSHVCVMKGTQHNPLITADYLAFSGSEYGHTTGTWSTTGYNDITFNSTGNSDINRTGDTLLCVREYDHDYLNDSTGVTGSQFINGCILADNGSNQPKLVVTYSTPALTQIPKTADYTILGSECNGTNVFTNSGAGAGITFTLPSPTNGYIVNIANVQLTSTANPIYVNGNITSGSGTVTSALGVEVKFTADGTKWTSAQV